MLASRGLALFKCMKLLKNDPSKIQQIIRNGHNWSYRVAPAPPAPIVLHTAEFVAAVAWWWILWHLFTEPGHVTGEFAYPDASKWTDEELGIPSE